MLKRVKALEHEGYEFESADGSLALLIRRSLRDEPTPFHVDAYHVSMRAEGKTSVCEATVKVRVGGEHAHTVADGDGPVNALDGALRSALVKFYPDLQTVRLTDYKVRIVDSSVGTAAQNPGAHRVERRHVELDDHRRQRQHHRGEPAGAGRQPRVWIVEEVVHSECRLTWCKLRFVPHVARRFIPFGVACLVATIFGAGIASTGSPEGLRYSESDRNVAQGFSPASPG